MQSYLKPSVGFEKQLRSNVLSTLKKKRFSTLSIADPALNEHRSMQFLLDADSAHSQEPAKPRHEFGVNTISQGRLIESSINQIVDEYKVKLSSKKNRLPKPLPGDRVKQKKVAGGAFGKMRRQVSQEQTIEVKLKPSSEHFPTSQVLKLKSDRLHRKRDSSDHKLLPH